MQNYLNEPLIDDGNESLVFRAASGIERFVKHDGDAARGWGEGGGVGGRVS